MSKGFIDKRTKAYKWTLEQFKKARKAAEEETFDRFYLYLIKKEREDRAAGKK